MTTTSITREYRWEMGHALLHHKGKCYRPHGHNYRMEVEVSGAVQDDGMVVDFSDVDDWVEPLIEKYFDHRFWINEEDERFDMDGEVKVDGEPTAENLALWFWDVWKDFAKSGHAWPGVTLERITLYETDRASATIRRS